jgi:redox-sensitive bicupin YhaK (pirin superfamily)
MHRDSGGHESVIGPGGVQWMTAGRGLVHAELSPESFKRHGGPLEILQLWVNLPARLKMTEPRYLGLQRDQVPTVLADHGKVAISAISGTWEGTEGPIRSLTDVQMATAEIGAGGRLAVPVPPGRTVFLYVVRGEVRVGGTEAPAHSLVELDSEGERVVIAAAEDAVVLLGHALPHGEPIVAHGPFVMNTREEILEAVRDYQAGRFGAGLDA